MPKQFSASVFTQAPAAVRLPPQNLEAEASVIGALLIDPDAVVKVAELLQPGDFYRTDHQLMYEAILNLFEKRQPIDLLTVTEELEKRHKLEEAGGASNISAATGAVPTATNVKHYADIVREKSVLRRIISAGTFIADMGYREELETAAVLDQSEQKLFEVSQKFLKTNFVPISEILSESFDRIDRLSQNKGELRGVASGFKDLDNLLAGFQKSDLIILAARPGIGKTSMAVDFAAHAAVDAKLPVAIFSLEMSREQLVDRLLCSQAGIDLWKLRTGNLVDEDFQKLGIAMGILSEAPIFIDDQAMCSAMEVRAKARRLQMEQGGKLGLIVIDYLQLMVGGGKNYADNRVQEVSEISRSLKGLARDLNVPVIALSQLSRTVESRRPQIPQLSDLRESGCLAGDTLVIRADTGARVPIRELVGQTDIQVWSLDEHYRLVKQTVSKVFPTGKKQLFDLKLRSGRRIKATANHKFYTLAGWQRLDELKVGDELAVMPIGDIALEQSEWDEVVSIEPLGIEEVFDATVPGTHNFVANDIVVHNSIEQDADVVMFIYREDYYDQLEKREPTRPGLADIIIAKHRNGPTGKVELFFKKEYTSFQNLDKSQYAEPPEFG